jgi:predicted secreted protein
MSPDLRRTRALTRPSSIGSLASAAAAVLAMSAATAQTLPSPEHVINLSASASVEVQRDWLTVVFSTTREGPEALAVQTQLKQALDAALAEARKIARPGDVEVQGGAFSLHPRYSPKGTTNGWVGQTELIVQGRDMAAIAQLTGRIQTLTIGRVGYSLSRAAQEQVESQVTAQAVARFRARAEQTAQLFGSAGYLLREVSIGGGEPPQGMPMMEMRARVAAAPMADAPLPVEGGKSTVTITVNGSVQGTR